MNVTRPRRSTVVPCAILSFGDAPVFQRSAIERTASRVPSAGSIAVACLGNRQRIAPVHGTLASAVGRWRFPRHYDMRPLMLALTRHEPGGGPNSAAQSHTDMLRGKDILSHFIHACYMCPIGFAYVHVLRRCTTLGRMLACRCSRETTNRWDNGEREAPLIACGPSAGLA